MLSLSTFSYCCACGTHSDNLGQYNSKLVRTFNPDSKEISTLPEISTNATLYQHNVSF